jgi:hypothetical protein
MPQQALLVLWSLRLVAGTSLLEAAFTEQYFMFDVV